jgi:uncharacterized protein YbjT (DUF2867 family)
MAKTALIIGASGLIGNEVLRIILEDSSYNEIKIFVRKEIQLKHPKLKQYIVDFDNLKPTAENIKGDVVFCCLGTTIKAAGSKEAFTKVDYAYVLNFAEVSKKNGIPRFIIVSSLGVTPEGGNFYLTVKRDIENALKNLKFISLIIIRPSMLLGERKEFRLGENIGKILMKSLSFLFVGKLKKYKAIEAAVVAKAMVALSKTDLENTVVFESNRLQELGKV